MCIPEPEFVNISGALESIPEAYVAWRVGTTTLFDRLRSGGHKERSPNL
jgi:hypothetical protein